MLKGAGYDVDVVSNGREALEKLSSDIALVISDVHMPEMDGVEMRMRLRKELPSVKIISMTGGGVQDKDEVLKITERLGAVKTLPKPFSHEDLLGAVEEVLA